MNTFDPPARLRLSYEAHVERLIRGMPDHHHDILRSVLRHPVHVEQVVRFLSLKSELTASDHECHNAIIGGPTPGVAGKFTVFEIGCTSALKRFEAYWRRLGYDSYVDYVVHILASDDKGLGLYMRMTGEPVPAELTADFVEKFIVGHVLFDLESDTLLMALQWNLSDGRLASYPRELADPDSVPPGAIQIPDVHLPGSRGYPLLVIPREDIEAQNCEKLLLEIVARADRAGSLSSIQGRIGFVVDGYNDDPRELFEIPQVKSYFEKLDRKAPHFLFFIANEGNGACVRLYLKMFISPEFFAMETPPPASLDQFSTFILTRLNAVADYCARNSKHEEHPLDPVTTAHQTYRACGYDVSRSQATAVLDSR